MPEYSGFFDSVDGDRKYGAEDMGRMFDGILVDGVVQGSGDGLRVYAQGSEMAVNVGTGRAYFNHRWYSNTSSLKKTISPSNPVNGRYDAVVLEINLSRAGRYVRISTIQGTPSASPARPSMSMGPEIIQYPLAYVYVGPNAAHISTAAIEDARGKDRTPWLTGVASNISLEGLTSQLTDEFNTWFNEVKDQLNQGGGGGGSAAIAALKARVDQIEPKTNQLYQTWNPSTMATSKPNATDFMPLVTNDNGVHKSALSTLRYDLFDPIPEMHNAIWRGQFIGTVASTAQKTAISSGTFTNLWLGDYWTVGGVDYVIVAFNYWKGVNGETRNHVVVMSRAAAQQTKFHREALTTERDASIYSVAQGYEATISNALGTLRNQPIEVATAFSGGVPSADVVMYREVTIPSAQQLMGTSPVGSVSGGAAYYHSFPTGCRQFPACAINQELIFSAGECWVQRPWSPNNAGHVYLQKGYIDYSSVTSQKGLRLVAALAG